MVAVRYKCMLRDIVIISNELESHNKHDGISHSIMLFKSFPSTVQTNYHKTPKYRPSQQFSINDSFEINQGTCFGSSTTESPPGNKIQ